jgi:hypothetical protein
MQASAVFVELYQTLFELTTQLVRRGDFWLRCRCLEAHRHHRRPERRMTRAVALLGESGLTATRARSFILLLCANCI